MDNGQIVEQGTHEDLMKIESGKYSQLYNIQFASQEILAG